MNDLNRIIQMANDLVNKAEQVAMLEDELKEAKKQLLQVEREDLPSLMSELGLKEIKLENGQIVQVVDDVDTKITPQTRAGAFNWLTTHGYGGLIKTEVLIVFGRGDHESAVAARDYLANQYGGAELKENVHPGTLKAFVKERMAEGEPVPMDLFNVYPYSKAKIKKGA